MRRRRGKRRYRSARRFGGNVTEKKDAFTVGNFVYGEDDKINEALGGLKFYKQFGNDSYEEVSVDKLTVKYEKDGETLSAKPETYSPSKHGGSSGTYSFTYGIAGATNTANVTFNVERAKSDAFSVALSKNTWRYGDKLATVTVKNPAGTTMSSSQSYDDSGVFSDNDDSEYGGLTLCAMTKSYYAAHGGSTISYNALTEWENDETKPNYGYNKTFGKNLLSYVDYEGDVNPDFGCGEYVLIACISETRDYKEIVCTAEFTVTAPDTPFGKTFVLTDLTARGDGDLPAPSEIIAMAAQLKADNAGKTVACDANGNISGTCDFGFGAFDELLGDDAFTLTFGKQADEYSAADPLYVSVKNGYDDYENMIELTGKFRSGVLTLSIRQFTDDETPVAYCFDFTFELQ